MRWFVLLLAAACNSSAPLDAQGNVGSTEFASVTTIVSSDPHNVLLVFADTEVTCADLAAGGIQGRAANALYVLLSDLVDGQQYPASFEKAYEVGSNSAVARAWFMRWTDACGVAEQTAATTGAAQVTVSGSNHYAGNFTFGFQNGLLYGHFDVEPCLPIAQADPPLCL